MHIPFQLLKNILLVIIKKWKYYVNCCSTLFRSILTRKVGYGHITYIFIERLFFISKTDDIYSNQHIFFVNFFQFILTVEGRGGKFNLKNTILNIGSGLALLGVSTVVCDFLLMYIKEKGVVKKKK